GTASAWVLVPPPPTLSASAKSALLTNPPSTTSSGVGVVVPPKTPCGSTRSCAPLPLLSMNAARKYEPGHVPAAGSRPRVSGVAQRARLEHVRSRRQPVDEEAALRIARAAADDEAVLPGGERACAESRRVEGHDADVAQRLAVAVEGAPADRGLARDQDEVGV